jgi:hypothetical protein
MARAEASEELEPIRRAGLTRKGVCAYVFPEMIPRVCNTPSLNSHPSWLDRTKPAITRLIAPCSPEQKPHQYPRPALPNPLSESVSKCRMMMCHIRAARPHPSWPSKRPEPRADGRVSFHVPQRR